VSQFEFFPRIGLQRVVLAQESGQFIAFFQCGEIPFRIVTRIAFQGKDVLIVFTARILSFSVNL